MKIRLALSLISLAVVACAHEPPAVSDHSDHVIRADRMRLREAVALVNSVSPTTKLLLIAPVGDDMLGFALNQSTAAEDLAEAARRGLGVKLTRAVENGVTTITLE
jgi:hypothetical protein